MVGNPGCWLGQAPSAWRAPEELGGAFGSWLEPATGAWLELKGTGGAFGSCLEPAQGAWLELQELGGRRYGFLDATLSRIGALMFENAVLLHAGAGWPIFEWLSAWGLNYDLILGFGCFGFRCLGFRGLGFRV